VSKAQTVIELIGELRNAGAQEDTGENLSSEENVRDVGHCLEIAQISQGHKHEVDHGKHGSFW